MLSLDTDHIQKDEAVRLRIQFRLLVCRLILRIQSGPNAYCVFDSVFNLSLQGLFQAGIKQLVELPQRL